MLRDALHPLDVAVSLRLLEVPEAGYQQLAQDLGLSASTAHGAVKRLVTAGLVRLSDGGGRRVNRRALLEFVEHGVKYAFPGVVGAPTRGVPTAYAGPVLADEIVSDEAVVWPHPTGSVVGLSVAPLLPKAAELPARCPGTYALLTAVDAVRIGRARERQIAMAYLREQLAA